MSQALPRHQSPTLASQNQIITTPEATDPIRKPVRQTCGYVFSIIGFVICILSLIQSINSVIDADDLFIFRILLLFSQLLIVYFYYSIIFIPEYAAGKPDIMKYLPIAIGIITRCIVMIILKRLGDAESEHSDIEQILGSICVLSLTYCFYMLDDERGSFCLRFKPWVYKKKPSKNESKQIKDKDLVAPFNV